MESNKGDAIAQVANVDFRDIFVSDQPLLMEIVGNMLQSKDPDVAGFGYKTLLLKALGSSWADHGTRLQVQANWNLIVVTVDNDTKILCEVTNFPDDVLIAKLALLL